MDSVKVCPHCLCAGVALQQVLRSNVEQLLRVRETARRAEEELTAARMSRDHVKANRQTMRNEFLARLNGRMHIPLEDGRYAMANSMMLDRDESIEVFDAAGRKICDL